MEHLPFKHLLMANDNNDDEVDDEDEDVQE